MTTYYHKSDKNIQVSQCIIFFLCVAANCQSQSCETSLNLLNACLVVEGHLLSDLVKCNWLHQFLLE